MKIQLIASAAMLTSLMACDNMSNGQTKTAMVDYNSMSCEQLTGYSAAQKQAWIDADGSGGGRGFEAALGLVGGAAVGAPGLGAAMLTEGIDADQSMKAAKEKALDNYISATQAASAKSCM